MDRDAKAGESAEAEIDRQTYRKLPFQRQVISRRRHVQQVCAPRCTIALGLLVLTCCPAAPCQVPFPGGVHWAVPFGLCVL